MKNYLRMLEDRVDVHPADDNEVLILCPFHGESNPSLSVNVKTGVFYCFSCKETGRFAKLIAEIDDISLEAADELVDDRAEVLLDDLQEEMLEGLDNLMDDDKPLKYFSTKSFEKTFPAVEGTPGLKYLDGRGISRRTARIFNLRWGREGVMADRVVIPIYTPNGKLLSYTGRTILDGVNPKTRKVRTGRLTLYGLHEILRDNGGMRLETMILVEGEFDAMYLQQHRVPAVSTMGTARLTAEQLSQVRHYTKTVVWAYDSDKAGREAQKRGIEATINIVPTLSVDLPKGKDPNDLTPDEVEKIFRRYV